MILAEKEGEEISMSLLLTFYAADLKVFVTQHKQMASAQTMEEVSVILEQLASYPHADFSLNFTIPDHTDALCQAMIAEDFPVPPASLDLFGTPLWYGEAASVHQLPFTFVLALTQASETSIKRIARRWMNSFLPESREAADAVLVSQNLLNALSELCTVASFALEHHQSLLLSFVW
jgi:hypothetical protein